jgi:hypothetical protein
MTSEFGTNVGLNASANKYSAVTIRQNKEQLQQKLDEGQSRKDINVPKGSLFNEDLATITTPSVDTAVAMPSVERKRASHTVSSLKDQFERALTDKYENAHNMLAEAFYGFKAGAAQTMLNVLDADPTEIDAIKQKVASQAKDKVEAGFQRLAHAIAEFEIYAS